MTVDTSSTDDSTLGAGAEFLSIEAAVAAAEAVLSQRFGSTITLIDAEDLAGSGPATVVRARVDSSPFALPRTLVIKHYPGPARPGQDDAFAREAASYQLFTALSPEDRMCPELLAHGADHRVLVIDDFGRMPTLEDKLCGGDSRAAETALLSWARSLGRLHFSTANREADFNALLRRLSSRGRAGDGGSRDHSVGVAPGEVTALVPALLAQALAVTVPEPVHQAADRAAKLLTAGAYRAFSPVDLWPDNNLVTDAGLRFLDFERGRVRSALIDAAHLRVPFVTDPHPLALPAGMSEAMVAAWRAEIVGLWPDFGDDDTLEGHLLDTELLLIWHATRTHLPALADVSNASRTGKAAALVTWWLGLAEHAGHSERDGDDAVAEHAATVADVLDARFGPGLRLELYPAFR
ncbi:phosphotransferase [Prauserella cavernicola]|uniref:Phosphotransferase n=1 Tax=Prauserella cavernicola TaxID=2800127 RepID=A0A934QXE1_9PSEU|nr:phosphotransferase [Prauserella cavernicola]MBK1788105.1 phosphotransferase [Prauserella cavernicola]